MPVNRWLDEESSGGSNPVTIGGTGAIGALRDEIDALKNTVVDNHTFTQTGTFGNRTTIMSIEADIRSIRLDITSARNSINFLVSTHDNTSYSDSEIDGFLAAKEDKHDNPSYSDSEIDGFLAAKEDKPDEHYNFTRLYLIGYLKIKFFNPQQYSLIASRYNLQGAHHDSTTIFYHFIHARPTSLSYVVDVTSENLGLTNVYTDNHLEITDKTLVGFTMKIRGGQFKIEKWHVFTCHVYTDGEMSSNWSWSA
jgi:hypothetical protein